MSSDRPLGMPGDCEFRALMDERLHARLTGSGDVTATPGQRVVINAAVIANAIASSH
jgi:hypothetical protein